MTPPVVEQQIATQTHGRYLIERPAGGSSATDTPGLIVGFHGYAEDAEAQLQRLRDIAAARPWIRVSVQALHPFYRGRTGDVVASWMTRQDRELAIADNLAYVAAVLDRVAGDEPVSTPIVFAGFSQGVAMAFRAACRLTRPAAVIACGGDVPPELTLEDLARIPAVLLGRGDADHLYRAEQAVRDADRLRGALAPLTSITFAGEHAWTPEFSAAAAGFLDAL